MSSVENPRISFASNDPALGRSVLKDTFTGETPASYATAKMMSMSTLSMIIQDQNETYDTCLLTIVPPSLLSLLGCVPSSQFKLTGKEEINNRYDESI